MQPRPPREPARTIASGKQIAVFVPSWATVAKWWIPAEARADRPATIPRGVVNTHFQLRRDPSRAAGASNRDLTTRLAAPPRTPVWLRRGPDEYSRVEASGI